MKFAVIMDYTFSAFQSEPRAGIERYLAENGIESVYFGIGGLNPDIPEDHAKQYLYEFITPEKFDWWAKQTRQMGFTWVQSSPFTRSSYHAEEK